MSAAINIEMWKTLNMGEKAHIIANTCGPAMYRVIGAMHGDIVFRHTGAALYSVVAVLDYKAISYTRCIIPIRVAMADICDRWMHNAQHFT